MPVLSLVHKLGDLEISTRARVRFGDYGTMPADSTSFFYFDTDQSYSGNIIDIRKGGNVAFQLDAAGNITTAGTVNGAAAGISGAVTLTPDSNARNVVQPTSGAIAPLHLQTSATGPDTTFTPAAAVRSGSYGWILNKQDKTQAEPHAFIFAVGGNPLWEWGIDFNTNNAVNGGTGGSYLACYDHTANGNVGADIWAMSLAEADTVSTGVKASKLSFFGTGTGTPATNTNLVTLSTGGALDLGGMSLTIKSANARDHLTLVQGHATSKRAAVNYNGLWLAGPDMAGTGDGGFTWRDVVNSKNRMYAQQTSGISAMFGFNTTAPIGGVTNATSADSSLYDKEQIAFSFGYSTIDNRSWSVSQIRDASTVKNFQFYMGHLGAGSTAVTPVSTSSFSKANGLRCSDTTLDLFTAPSGTNQALLSTLAITNNGTVAQIGVFGVTPASRAPAYTISNVSTTRSYDASSTTLTTLANTLGTLLADLRSYGWVQ